MKPLNHAASNVNARKGTQEPFLAASTRRMAPRSHMDPRRVRGWHGITARGIHGGGSDRAGDTHRPRSKKQDPNIGRAKRSTMGYNHTREQLLACVRSCSPWGSCSFWCSRDGPLKGYHHRLRSGQRRHKCGYKSHNQQWTQRKPQSER